MAKTTEEKTRLLAEGVMGWVKYDNNEYLMRTPQDRIVCVGNGKNPWSWDPYTNLAHAGEVMDAMRAKGWHWIASTHGQEYRVEFFMTHDVSAMAASIHLSYPAAICNAALLALGMVGEDEL